LGHKRGGSQLGGGKVSIQGGERKGIRREPKARGAMKPGRNGVAGQAGKDWNVERLYSEKKRCRVKVMSAARSPRFHLFSSYP